MDVHDYSLKSHKAEWRMSISGLPGWASSQSADNRTIRHSKYMRRHRVGAAALSRTNNGCPMNCFRGHIRSGLSTAGLAFALLDVDASENDQACHGLPPVTWPGNPKMTGVNKLSRNAEHGQHMTSRHSFPGGLKNNLKFRTRRRGIAIAAIPVP